ncbi:MAG: hypothetical protein E7637_09025 [Ruminococcaceae bacterium]|nr:hypothetical protein [Oscillospiraceae bacterium]
MKKPFLRNRKIRYGSITVVLTVLILAVTVLVNAVVSSLANRFSWYSDMNKIGLFETTEDCYTYLDTVFSEAKEEGRAPVVEIIFCDLAVNMEEEPTQWQLYQTALSIQERFPTQIRVTCYDILSNPTSVRKYATMTDYQPTDEGESGKEIQIPIYTTSLIVVCEEYGYHEVYSLAEFFSFKGNQAENLWGYNGERKLAAGIRHAITPDRPLACLTNNHGEVYYDFEIVNLLEDAGYRVTYLDLYKYGKIPEDCSLVVTYNPTSDMVNDAQSTVSETQILEGYLQKPGNSYWLFLGNASPLLPNFESFMAEWGVDFSYHTSNGNSYRYMVQDPSKSLTSDGYTIYGESTRSGKSGELLDGLYQHAIFKNATAMKPADGYLSQGNGSYQKGTRTMTSLYTGGKNATAWANGKAVADADNAILMSLTEQTVAGGSAYVGCVASAEFATETYLQSAVYGNSDVFCAAMEYQGMENTPIGLRIKPYEQTEISTLTTRNMLIWTLTLTLLPAVAVTTVAIIVFAKRRRA